MVSRLSNILTQLMKQLYFKLLIIALFCFASSASYSQADTTYYYRSVYVDGIYYVIYGYEYAIVEHSYNSGDITIPSSIEDEGKTIPVTEIGSSAFKGCSGLTSVIIPNSVTSIGAYAFQNCTHLTTIIIPDGVTAIYSSTFKGCTRLISVTLPNSVMSIGEDAFSGTAWYNNQPDGLVYANKVAYKYKGTMPEGTSIVIADGTVSIAPSAFEDCTRLSSITIPKSVLNIGCKAFKGCTSLTSVSIPEGVTSIGSSAFSGCTGLVSVTIPEGVTSIESSAFYDCNLTEISIPNSVTNIGGSAFKGCQIPSFVLPDNITNIGSDALGNSKVFANQGTSTLLALWKAQYIPYMIETENTIPPPALAIENKTQTTLTVKIDNRYDEYSYEITQHPDYYHYILMDKTNYTYNNLRPKYSYNLFARVYNP